MRGRHGVWSRARRRSVEVPRGELEETHLVNTDRYAEKRWAVPCRICSFNMPQTSVETRLDKGIADCRELSLTRAQGQL